MISIEVNRGIEREIALIVTDGRGKFNGKQPDNAILVMLPLSVTQKLLKMIEKAVSHQNTTGKLVYGDGKWVAEEKFIFNNAAGDIK